MYSICDGDASNMKELKGYDIFDFFDYVETVMKRKNG